MQKNKTNGKWHVPLKKSNPGLELILSEGRWILAVLVLKTIPRNYIRWIGRRGDYSCLTIQPNLCKVSRVILSPKSLASLEGALTKRSSS